MIVSTNILLIPGTRTYRRTLGTYSDVYVRIIRICVHLAVLVHIILLLILILIVLHSIVEVRNYPG